MSKTSYLFTQGYALLIGVGNYPYARPLPETINDATVLYKLLINPERAGYPQNNVKLLVDSQASRQGIIDGLDWLIDCSTNHPDATIIIYYSGHGGVMDNDEYILLPYDFQLNGWRNVSISKELFSHKINQIKTKKLLLFLDCCHAAGITSKDMKSQFTPSNTALYEQLSRGKGKVIVASCRATQFSYIFSGASYSAFTNALIDALDQHGDSGGYATVLQTLAIVSRVMSQTSGNKQIPVFEMEGVEDFPICRINVEWASQYPFKKSVDYNDRDLFDLPAPNILRHKIPLRPAFFLGRKNQLKEIHEKLTDRSMRQNILLLSGIGGMGKTTLMQEYVRSPSCQGAFDKIIFASVRHGIRQALASATINACKLERIAPDPDIHTEKSFEFSIQELRKASGINLFIIDNVNEKNYDELKRIKSALMDTGWKFLITTRTAPDGFAYISVEELEMEDAKLLFAYHFAGNSLNDDLKALVAFPEGREEKLREFIKEQIRESDLNQLLTHIVRHTLLTELLAKAAVTKGLSFATLLTILEKQDYSHPDLQRTISTGSHAEFTYREHLNGSTLHIYLLSLFETEYLETPTGDESLDQQNKAKAIMLRFFSVLPSNDIPIGDLKALWRVDKKDENPFEDRLNELRQIGWIQGKQDMALTGEWEQNLFFKMHPLVQEVVYEKLKPDTKNCRPLIHTITDALNNPGEYTHIYKTYATGVVENFDNLKKKFHGKRL